MQALEQWRLYYDIHNKEWMKLSAEEKLDRQAQNPNFVIFQDSYTYERAPIGMLRPDHCDIDHLYAAKLRIFKSYQKANDDAQNTVIAMLSMADVVVLPDTSTEDCIFIVRKSQWENAGFQVERDILDGSCWSTNKLLVTDIARRFSYIENKREKLRLIIEDIDFKILSIVYWKIRRRIRELNRGLFYVETCGRRLMFVANEQINDYGYPLSFLGELNEEMNIEKIISNNYVARRNIRDT